MVLPRAALSNQWHEVSWAVAGPRLKGRGNGRGVSRTARVAESAVVGGCSSLESDFNELLHKLGRIISSTALVSEPIQSL